MKWGNTSDSDSVGFAIALAVSVGYSNFVTAFISSL
jgi:hypothetical protein